MQYLKLLKALDGTRWAMLSAAAVAGFTLLVGCGEPAQPGEGIRLEAMGLTEGEVIEAASTGDVARLQEWLSAHPELVEWRDDAERTLLHHAGFAQQQEAMRLLMDHGADPDAVDAYGDTPMAEIPGVWR